MRVSVVIPTYRRPDLLARCVAALTRQNLPAAEYEILVADDAASPATRGQVEAWAGFSGPRIHYVPVCGTHGPAAARNAGWQLARGAVIAFTDDDTIPDPDWLAWGLRALEQSPDLAAVTGRTVVPISQAPTDYEKNEAGLENADFITANCFCRKDRLAALGGFDERFRQAWREDSDLHFELLHRKAGIAREPRAVIVHPVRPAPWGVSLRMQRKALYDALLFKKHPRLYRRFVRPGVPWGYYGSLSALAVALGAWCLGRKKTAAAAGCLWGLWTTRFCLRRLRGTSRAPRHIAEMVVTSLLIPPLSVYWRLRGAVQFRTWFL
jgi:glycosyltransferase involved in cell wall biosynthesis